MTSRASSIVHAQLNARAFNRKRQSQDELHYALRTPNHGTSNLITNLASPYNLELQTDGDGLRVIRRPLVNGSHVELANDRDQEPLRSAGPHSLKRSGLVNRFITMQAIAGPDGIASVQAADA